MKKALEHIKHMSGDDAVDQQEGREGRGLGATTTASISASRTSSSHLVVLKLAILGLVFGRRYGMVGHNGLSKSTLLKMISSGPGSDGGRHAGTAV